MELNKKLGYMFRDPKLLEQALTHNSYIYEKSLPPIAGNERLEFLGDAVLELLVSELLYTNNPNSSEGQLTKTRAALVCEESLANCAKSLDLGNFLRLGRGETIQGGAKKPSILSDALEAVIGAVFLDGGFEAAKTLVQKLLGGRTVLADSPEPITDYKTALQEILQKKSGQAPTYTIIAEDGPPHNREFTAQVIHEERILGKGSGRSKKEAEQQAAAAALRPKFFRSEAYTHCHPPLLQL